MTLYPNSALRALALHVQKLDTPNGSEPVPSHASLYETIEQTGAVQIDTLQMVHRAHYLSLWSRHAAYDPSLLDDLAFDPEQRRLFEGWYHAACYIPIHEYRYQLPRQRHLRENGHHWRKEWIHAPGNRELVAATLERIRQEGGLRASDFEHEGPRYQSWWDWKPAKLALEHLFAFGDVMISKRVKFQRVYDLTERVLPAGIDLREPSAAERDRFWVERGARAIGVGLPHNPGDYTWMKRTTSRPITRELMERGRLVEIQGETLNGPQTLVIHCDNLPLLERAASGELRAERTTFLNPWDSFWWAQDRDEALWGFEHRIELYVPAPQRVYGYYLMPILHHDRLVGRFDPKLERKTNTLRLRALHLEPGIAPDEALVADTATALRDFLSFHNARNLIIESSHPSEFGEKLLRAL